MAYCHYQQCFSGKTWIDLFPKPIVLCEIHVNQQSFTLSYLKFLCKSAAFRRHVAITTCSSPSKFEPVKFFSTISKEQSFSVSYLIDTCGFSPERAASVSKHLHFESREKPDLVIKFFENLGFSQAQAIKVVRSSPNLLKLDPERILLPKIEFLKSKGSLSCDIPGIVLVDPNTLNRSLDKHIIPTFDFFGSLLQSDEKFVKVLKKFPDIVGSFKAYAIANINLLRTERVSESHIIKFIEYQPGALPSYPHRFKTFVEEPKEMGFNPQRYRFVQAVWTLIGISKFKWGRKSAAFKKWGWTDDDILEAIRRFPLCMTLSETKLEFFVSKMGCKSSIVARRPLLLSLSLNKQIIPRVFVIQALLSKGLVTKLSLATMFECSETVFVKKYILHHVKEAEELLKLYHANWSFLEVTRKQSNCKVDSKVIRNELYLFVGGIAFYLLYSSQL